MREATSYCETPEQADSQGQWLANTLRQLSFQNADGDNMRYKITIEPCVDKTRTLTQNNCLHQWCAQLANILNDAGYERTMESPLLKSPVSLPWDKIAVKDFLWRPVQLALCGEESTKYPSKIDYPAIYDVIVRHLGEHFGITAPPWPTRFGDSYGQ